MLASRIASVALWIVVLSTSVAAQQDERLYPSGGRPEGYAPGFDVRDYDLTFDLFDTSSTVNGRAVLHMRRANPARPVLVLDLVDAQIYTVLVNGRLVAATASPGSLRVPLPDGSNDALTVVVRYRVTPKNGLVIRTDSLGRWSAFGDNWPNNARHWIPSIDHPSDKATVSFTVTAPSNLRVIANGDLIEETPLPTSPGEKPRTLTRWRESRPVPVYTMVIAAAPLATYDLGRGSCGHPEFGCVHQMVHYFAEERPFMPGPFAQAQGIVAFFSSLVGPFPYEKLAHLQSSTSYGGMENSSAIFYSDQAFKRRTLGPSLIAHETAHQWFGDAVTEREWSDLWLSEGFATYFASLWTQKSLGDSAFRAELASTRTAITRSPTTNRPVIDTDQTNYGALLNTNSYQKGGWTLHMLRRLVGDSAFFKGLRSYYTKYRHGNAMTDDLRAELERSSGRDLKWFFEQWLRRPGYADITVSWRYDGPQRRLVLDLTQGSKFPPYRFPLVVEITDAAGAPHRMTVQINATSTQRVVVPLTLASTPKSLTLDPGVDVLAAFTLHEAR
jgi:aminopeptidase N